VFVLSVRSRKYEDLYILKDLVSVQHTLKDRHGIEIDDPYFYINSERWIEQKGLAVIMLEINPKLERHYEFNL